MSYTPPAGNAANLQFGTGYSAPAGNAADLSFLTGNTVTGFASTQFGTPSVRFAHTGAVSTQFGQHHMRQNLTLAADGAHVTRFGVYSVTMDVPGIYSTQFGSHTVHYKTPSVSRGVNWGIHHTEYALSTHLIAVMGDNYVKPANDNITFTLPIGTSWCDAFGFLPTQFGDIFIPKKAKGSYVTNFGMVYSPYLQVLQDVTVGQVTSFKAPLIPLPTTGWQNGTFGAPEITNLCQSSGVLVTVFGGPDTRLYATGDTAVKFGEVSGWSHFDAYSFGEITRWNYPYVGYTPVDQIVDAYGGYTTRFGWPQKAWGGPTINRTVVAGVFEACVFGQPVCVTRVEVSATGSIFGEAGNPRVGKSYSVSGAQDTAFGTHTCSKRGRATGQRDTFFGQPSNRRALPAVGTYQPTRWGKPKTVRPDIYKAYSLSPRTWVSVPKGTRRFNYQTSGSLIIKYGAHSSHETHLVTMLPPNTRLGKPLLRRAPLC
jgi:hypothetical protein